jgi:signal transduction histidine kinase
MHAPTRSGGISTAAGVTAVPRHDPAAGLPADPDETTARLAEDRDRIAADINDRVIRRLFSTGLSLQHALGLMDGHRAADRIRLAITELDQAIRDLRDAVFDTRRSEPPDDAASG